MRSKLMMLKFRGNISRKDAKAQRKTQRNRRLCGVATLREMFLLLLLSGLVFVTGCRRDMQDQPKMKPYRGTTFFADGLSSRQPIDGTVARGQLRSDTEFFTGKK